MPTSYIRSSAGCVWSSVMCEQLCLGGVQYLLGGKEYKHRWEAFCVVRAVLQVLVKE